MTPRDKFLGSGVQILAKKGIHEEKKKKFPFSNFEEISIGHSSEIVVIGLGEYLHYFGGCPIFFSQNSF